MAEVQRPVLGLNAMGIQFLPPVHLGLTCTFSPAAGASPHPFDRARRFQVDALAQFTLTYGFRGDQLSVGAIERVQETVPIGMHQHLAL